MVWDFSIRGGNAQTLKGVLCGRLESTVLHSKSSSSIPRLALGVIVQGFIRIVRMTLEIPVDLKLGTAGYFAPKHHAIGSHNL